MSSIIFATDKEQAFVATDTLAVDTEGNPLQFCSKAIYLPHLRTIIAGTGIGGFANDWGNDVNNSMSVSGIRNLDYHTPSALREKWKALAHKQDFPEGITTTIYHIGIGEDSEEVFAYAYRSENNFSSEEIPPGIRFKPKCELPPDLGFIEALQPMMEEQRNIQEQKPEHERIYIGGQCILMHLTKDGCATATVFDFDDYPKQLDYILNKSNR